MTKETLIALVNAGFTKQEILKYFTEEESSPAPAPTPTPAPAPQPASPVEPAPIPTPTPAPSINNEIETLRNLIAQAQTMNLLNIQTPTPQPITAEDALASLIDPPKTVSN